MTNGVIFIILGIFYMAAGTHEWSFFSHSEMFSFKEVSILGIVVMLVGCIICSIEIATKEIVKTLKEK